jgi:hypothetical protein
LPLLGIEGSGACEGGSVEVQLYVDLFLFLLMLLNNKLDFVSVVSVALELHGKQSVSKEQ